MCGCIFFCCPSVSAPFLLAILIAMYSPPSLPPMLPFDRFAFSPLPPIQGPYSVLLFPNLPLTPCRIAAWCNVCCWYIHLFVHVGLLWLGSITTFPKISRISIVSGCLEVLGRGEISWMVVAPCGCVSVCALLWMRQVCLAAGLEHKEKLCS